MPAELDQSPIPPRLPLDEEQPQAGQSDQPQSWSFALFALLTTAAIVAVALATPLAFDELFVFINGLGGDQSSDEGRASSLVMWNRLLVFQLAMVVLTLLMANIARGTGSALGWRPPIGRMSWLQPLLVTIAVSIVTSVIAFSLFADIIAKDLEPIRKMIAGAPLWLAFLALSIGAPLSEELLFRGYLLHRLEQTPLGFWGGALVANIGWTFLHVGYSWLSLADVFLAGVLFSWALWRTRSVWVPIAFHALYNATVFIMLLIPSEKSPVPALWPASAFW